MDLGCYAVYPTIALLGKPTAVSYAPLMLPTGVDGGGTLVLRYPEGIATLVISKCSHSWNETEIQTENGTISVDNLGEWAEVSFRKKGMEPQSITVPNESPPPNNLWWEMDAFVKLVQRGQQEDDILTWVRFYLIVSMPACLHMTI